MLAPTCGLAFVDLLATRRALSWYLSLDFQFASAGVGALHARLAEPDLTGMKLHELLMPLPLRTRFNYTLYAGVLDMGTFDGWAWLKRALDELNAHLDAINTAHPHTISKERRLMWSGELQVMLQQALESPPAQARSCPRTAPQPAAFHPHAL